MVTRAVVESIEKKSNLMAEIEELKFQEIWNVEENSGKMQVEDLFSALMDENVPEDSEYFNRFSKSEKEYFSPLSLSLAKISSSFSQEFLHKYIFLFSDAKTFSQLLQMISMDRTNNFHQYIQSVIDGTSKLKTEARNFCSVSVIKSKISEILHHSGPESPEEIKQILLETPSVQLLEVLQSAVDKIAAMKDFSPFTSSSFSKSVIEILKLSKENLKLDVLLDKFASDVLKCLSKEEWTVEQDHLAESFKLLPLPSDKLEELLEVLTEIKVQKISSSATLKTVITGLCYNLSLNKYGLKEELFSKLFCIIEVMIPSQESEEMVREQLTDGWSHILTLHCIAGEPPDQIF